MEVITQPLENAETGKSNKKQQKSQSILFLFFAIALLRVVESHTSPSRYHRVQAAPAVIILYVCISNPLCIYVCVVIYLECMNCRVVQPTDNAAVVVVSVLFFFSLLRSCELVGFGAQCVMYKMTQHCFQFQFLSLFLLPIFFLFVHFSFCISTLSFPSLLSPQPPLLLITRIRYECFVCMCDYNFFSLTFHFELCSFSFMLRVFVPMWLCV